MFKNRRPVIQLNSKTPQNTVGFGSFKKHVRQLDIGVRKNPDDCPPNSSVFHLVNEGVWVYVELGYVDCKGKLKS